MRKKVYLNISIIIFILAIGSLYGLIGMNYKNIVLNDERAISANKIKNENELQKEYGDVNKDVLNMLVVGSDAREGDKKSRSDTIMVFSIDRFNKCIRIMSIMRDTYAMIPGYTQQKINHAFAYGGPELLQKTVENNFGIEIDKYVVINFKAFKDIIDIIGGIDVELDEMEVADLNNCMYGIKEKDIVEVSNVGLNHLNGMQALAYARMRHNGKGIYDRSKRQRDIMQTTIEKSKKVSLIKYPSIANVLLKSIKTDIGLNEALKLSYVLYTMKNPEIKQMHVPPVDMSENTTIENKGWVIKFDKPAVKSEIHKFLYN